MRSKELILYKEIEKDPILERMMWLMENYESQDYNKEEKIHTLYQCIHDLIAIAEDNCFDGNIWAAYITYLLVNDENSYSKGCEIGGKVEGTLNYAAIHDFIIIKEILEYDFKEIREYLSVVAIDMIFEYEKGNYKIDNKPARTDSKEFVETLSKVLICCRTSEDMKAEVTKFYQAYGVGKLGLNKAFRIKNKNDTVEIIPIPNSDNVRISDLIGYEIAKKKLQDNTLAFIEGKRANNCLLFGDAGTGKSSSVKGILNEYYSKGLRVIEVYKHQFKELNQVISEIRNRNYKFIIYMDDLSFEDFEIEYKYLKAIIEGGIESKPDNVLIYATSNRRHLIREKFSDKEERDDDLHTRDTIQEKLSLSARFGTNIFFGAPNKREFQNIVKKLAEKHDIVMEEEVLLLEANKWELFHGGLSGRTAQQFITYLLGQEK